MFLRMVVCGRRLQKGRRNSRSPVSRHCDHPLIRAMVVSWLWGYGAYDLYDLGEGHSGNAQSNTLSAGRQTSPQRGIR